MPRIKQGWAWDAGDERERTLAYEQLHAWLRNRLLVGPVQLVRLVETDFDHATRRGIAVVIEEN